MRWVALVLLLLPTVVEAGSLSLTPTTFSGSVGDRVTLTLIADTQGVLVTAVEAEVTYDPAFLQPLAVSTAGSAFSLWATEPDTSRPGTVQLSGWAGAPQVGSTLRVVEMVFTVRSAGVHEVLIASGALLANDGKSSNILSELGRARIETTVAVAGLVLGASSIDQPPLPPTFSVSAEVAEDRLVISGTTDPGARVVLTLMSDSGVRTITADAPYGSFVIVDERLMAGTYTLSGETYRDGVVSAASEAQVFTIAPRPALVAAAILGSPSYLTLLVGIGSFILGFVLYRILLFFTSRRR
jgi:hypothetical protein